VLEGLGGVVPLVWIYDKKLGDEILCFFGYQLSFEGVEVVVALFDALEHFFGRAAFEGDPSGEEEVHDDSYAPVIASEVVAPFEDFWCDIMRCPNYLMERVLILLVEPLTQPKVNDPYLRVLILVEE
jgi:hypothetical protein